MTRVDIDGESYACPFATLFRALTAGEERLLRDSITALGIHTPVLVYLSPAHGRAILDGLNRLRLGLALGVEIPIFNRGKLSDEKAKALATDLNRARRHLTVEEQQAERGERVKRVVAARTGPTPQSLRAIAAAEQVSHIQIRRDLAEASGAPGVTPGPPAAVQGSDGKAYPAARPKARKRTTLAQKASRAATALAGLVKGILNTQGSRLEAIAVGYGVPITADGWTALDAIRATLRDLAQPAVNG